MAQFTQDFTIAKGVEVQIQSGVGTMTVDGIAMNLQTVNLGTVVDRSQTFTGVAADQDYQLTVGVIGTNVDDTAGEVSIFVNGAAATGSVSDAGLVTITTPTIAAGDDILVNYETTHSSAVIEESVAFPFTLTGPMDVDLGANSLVIGSSRKA